VLPLPLVENVLAVAPEDLKHNMNRLVVVALQEYVKRKKEEAFEAAMAVMAGDPMIRNEIKAVEKEFRGAESDGLNND
jgi:hypothetical protein